MICLILFIYFKAQSFRPRTDLGSNPFLLFFWLGNLAFNASESSLPIPKNICKNNSRLTNLLQYIKPLGQSLKHACNQ